MQSSSSLLTAEALWSRITSIVPALNSSSHKGQCGRVSVMGGSKAYTGAPYFAAATALHMGADLSTVFCSVEAAIPIKSYSPDLMVRPTLFPTYMAQKALDELRSQKDGEHSSQNSSGKSTRDEAIELVVRELNEWTNRMDVMVIGPGLGKDDLMIATIAEWLRKLKTASEEQEKQKQQPSDTKKKSDAPKLMPIVIDGDGIHLITENPKLFGEAVSGDSSSSNSSSVSTPSLFHSHILLTPNAMEFRRLWNKFVDANQAPDFDLPLDEHRQFLKGLHDGAQVDVNHPLVRDTARLASKMGGVCIIRKGEIDVVSDGRYGVLVTSAGCPRRVGGQGDVLAGSIGTFLAWTEIAKRQREEQAKKGHQSENPEQGLSASILAAYAGSTFCRTLQREAFSHHGRSMLPSHLLEVLPAVIQRTFPVDGVHIAKL